jgi:general secretion pathway protein G
MLRKKEAGFTLVEVTIILLVLVILGGILLPTIERFIDLARYAKAKEDLGMFAAIIELWKVDNCSRFFKQNGNSLVVNDNNRVDMLISDAGAAYTPAIDPTPGPAWGISGSEGYWDDPYGVSASLVVDTMEDQLVTNQPMGSSANAYPAPGPNPASCGWRGAYISAPLGPDPWGTRYMANVAFLGQTDGTTRPLMVPGGTAADKSANFRQMDVFVLSAGPDKIVSTYFTVNGVVAQKDDLIALVNGGF